MSSLLTIIPIHKEYFSLWVSANIPFDDQFTDSVQIVRTKIMKGFSCTSLFKKKILPIGKKIECKCLKTEFGSFSMDFFSRGKKCLLLGWSRKSLTAHLFTIEKYRQVYFSFYYFSSLSLPSSHFFISSILCRYQQQEQRFFLLIFLTITFALHLASWFVKIIK